MNPFDITKLLYARSQNGKLTVNVNDLPTLAKDIARLDPLYPITRTINELLNGHTPSSLPTIIATSDPHLITALNILNSRTGYVLSPDELRSLFDPPIHRRHLHDILEENGIPAATVHPCPTTGNPRKYGYEFPPITTP